MKSRNIELHIQTLAVLMAAVTLMASMGLLIGGLVLLPAALVIPLTDKAVSTGVVESLLLALGSAAVLFAGFNLILGLSAAYGLLKRRPWGRWLGIVDNALSLLSFPLGTIMGAYGLWVLLPPDAADYLSGDDPQLKNA